MANLLILSYEHFLRRPTQFLPLASALKDKLVFLDITGRDHIQKAESPFRIFDSRLAFSFKPGEVTLLVGRSNSKFNKSLIETQPNKAHFIDMEELVSAFPEMVPLSIERGLNYNLIKDTKAHFKHRLPNQNAETPLKINSILITSNTGIQNWDESIQVILDYHSSEDGTIDALHFRPKRDPNKAIPICVPYFESPKGVLGAEHFVNGLRTTYGLIYGRQVTNLKIHGIKQVVEKICEDMGKLPRDVVVDEALITLKQGQTQHIKHQHHHSHQLPAQFAFQRLSLKSTSEDLAKQLLQI